MAASFFSLKLSLGRAVAAVNVGKSSTRQTSGDCYDYIDL